MKNDNFFVLLLISHLGLGRTGLAGWASLLGWAGIGGWAGGKLAGGFGLLLDAWAWACWAQAGLASGQDKELPGLVLW